MRDRESALVAYSWLIESVTVPKRFPRNFPPFDSHRRVTSNPYPDESVDLAAIPLRISTEDAGRESAPGVVLEQFSSAEDTFEGASVIVLGFPGGSSRSRKPATFNPISPASSATTANATIRNCRIREAQPGRSTG
jgi:hypothetical protein